MSFAGIVSVDVYMVEESEARMRLDRFVEGRLPDVSRGRIRRAILRGEITVNGASRESGRRVAAGDQVEFRAQAPVLASMAEEPIPISVLYEDDALLVVDKPSGMPRIRRRVSTPAPSSTPRPGTLTATRGV